MKLNFISQPIYLLAICFVKISVGFFLLRIAVRPFFRRLIIGIMGQFCATTTTTTTCLTGQPPLIFGQSSWAFIPLVVC